MDAARVAVVAAVAMLGHPALGQEHGAVSITPNMGDGQPLTIEVQNLSKLPVEMNGGTISFPSGSDPCVIELPAGITVEPAGSARVKLAENAEVLACLERSRGGAPTRLRHPFVLSDRQLMQPGTQAQLSEQTHLQQAAVSFKLKVGNQPETVSQATWHLSVE
jgi:hypothetical protein